MRKLLLVLLAMLLLVSSAGAESISGQRRDTFEQYYAENLVFINENANRHLLPLAMARRSSNERDGRVYYEIFGDVLSMSLRTDPSGGIIEQCQIVLAAPQGMTLGDAAYNNFVISGYHSYALLMAMSADADPLKRYALVPMVEEGMRAAEGDYTAQIGVYALTCTRMGSTVTMSFANTRAQDALGETEPQEGLEPQDIPEESMDEGAGQG